LNGRNLKSAEPNQSAEGGGEKKYNGKKRNGGDISRRSGQHQVQDISGGDEELQKAAATLKGKNGGA